MAFRDAPPRAAAPDAITEATDAYLALAADLQAPNASPVPWWLAHLLPSPLQSDVDWRQAHLLDVDEMNPEQARVELHRIDVFVSLALEPGQRDEFLPRWVVRRRAALEARVQAT